MAANGLAALASAVSGPLGEEESVLAEGEGAAPEAGAVAGAAGIAEEGTAAKVLSGTSKQFGKKFGEHMDPNLTGYRTSAEYQQLANDIYNDPASVRTVLDNGEIRYRRGDDLLRLDPQGNFRSLYKDPR